MVRLIDQETKDLLLIPATDDKIGSEEMNKLFTETLEHAHQCVTKVERFHGRESILSKIHAYLLSDSRQPLVIHGESGCGKTSVLAKAAMQVSTELFYSNEYLANDIECYSPKMQRGKTYLPTAVFVIAGNTFCNIMASSFKPLQLFHRDSEK